MDGQSNAVKIVSWFLIVVSVSATLARLWTKWTASRTFKGDDLAIVLAVVLNVGSNLAAATSGSLGVGTPVGALDQAHIQNSEKALYATEILTIPTLCLAKLSIVLLFRQIFVQSAPQRFTLGLGVFIAVWCLASVFALAFQNGVKEPWNRQQPGGIALADFWRFSTAMNIATDVVLVVLPVPFVAKLQVATQRKAIVLVCFGARLIDVAVSAVQLSFTGTLSSPDVTGAIWQWVLCNQIVQGVTVVTSNIPYLKQLLEAFPDARLLTAPYVEFTAAASTERVPTYVLKDTQGRDETSTSTGSGERREAYSMFDAGTVSTARVEDSGVTEAAIQRPAQIHVHQSIDVEEQSLNR